MRFGFDISKGLHGTISVPADKSITHRAILFNSIARGDARVQLSLLGRDNLASLRIMQQLGVQAEAYLPESMYQLAQEEGIKNVEHADGDVGTIVIHGRGFEGLVPATQPLNCGNSGTTARLLCGLLAGCPFSSTLIGDGSLSKRPFKRVVEPLSLMGARFSGTSLPLTIEGGNLSGTTYCSEKASAQVKSAITLAGLQAKGKTVVCEPHLSRNHTELMLKGMGAQIEEHECQDGSWEISLEPKVVPERLKATDVVIPGDFSSAAFFLVAGSLFPNSDLVIENVGINPTRIGLYSILQRMAARIEFQNIRVVGGEDVADIRVQSSELNGVDVSAHDVVMAIDEIPILALAAAFAQGRTVISGAEELRVKESDRLAMMASLLTRFGCKVEERPDGMIIEGIGAKCGSEGKGKLEDLSAAAWKNSGDHRISMTSAILELLTFGECEIIDYGAIETSFPTFIQCFKALSQA